MDVTEADALENEKDAVPKAWLDAIGQGILASGNGRIATWIVLTQGALYLVGTVLLLTQGELYSALVVFDLS